MYQVFGILLPFRHVISLGYIQNIRYAFYQIYLCKMVPQHAVQTYKNKSKTVHNCTMKMVIGVSKKHNSVWRVYYHDFNEDDKLCLFTKKN